MLTFCTVYCGGGESKIETERQATASVVFVQAHTQCVVYAEQGGTVDARGIEEVA